MKFETRHFSKCVLSIVLTLVALTPSAYSQAPPKDVVFITNKAAEKFEFYLSKDLEKWQLFALASGKGELYEKIHYIKISTPGKPKPRLYRLRWTKRYYLAWDKAGYRTIFKFKDQ